MGIIKVAICDDDQYMCEKVHDFLKLFFSRQHITVLYYFFADGMYLLESDEIFDIVIFIALFLTLDLWANHPPVAGSPPHVPYASPEFSLARFPAGFPSRMGRD